VRHAPRGFTARGVSTAVVENGSFITMDGWMPLIGYQLRRELSDTGSRREHGLPARPIIPSLYDLEARSDAYGRESIDLEVTIGTTAGQTAVAPGELLRTWTEGGRSYFQYATDAPIGLGYALFSADYEVRKARWRDVALEVVHHPEHDLNVERVVRGMQASLEQLSTRFGPYPYKVLRFVEYPGAGGSLHASASTIWYLELFSLFDPEHEPRRLDLPFAVTGHEVAHQWWGGQAARVEGIAVLSESLAWYSAMGVVEEEYGTGHLERLLAFMRESYLNLRPRAGLPLLRASDSFLAYREGPFAMYALREYVGEENVDVALRRFKTRVGSPEPPFATTLDLYAELQAVTPDSLQYLLADLFERNTFWELQTREASAQQTPSGEWQVKLEVEARKVAVDTAGVETDIAMNDLIEIGVFAPAEGDEAPGTTRGAPLYLAMHRIRTGPQTITVTVPQRPARAGIDPRYLLIDVQPGDNVLDVPDTPRE
jgi:ABC-2 type transport system permease protein